MEVACDSCGASLRLNPALEGTSVSCPQCGAKVKVPEAPAATPPPRRRLELEPDEPEPMASRKLKLPLRFTLWLLGAQATLAILGLTCLAGAFYGDDWNPPEWSYFRENPLILAATGIALIAAGWLAHYLPVLTTLAVVLLVVGACSLYYLGAGRVDASRVIALSLAMLALWLALQHRRANLR